MAAPGMREFAQTDEQAEALRGLFRAMAEQPDDMAFTPHPLSMIQARTLVVQGDRDSFFGPEIAVDMFRSIPDSSLCIMPDTGHVPNRDGHGNEVIGIARAFMDKPASESAGGRP